MSIKYLKIIVFFVFVSMPINAQNRSKNPFIWDAATIYSIVIDRFANGNPNNDNNSNRKQSPSYSLGGDLRGIINKIDEGYFDRLGVNAISITPIFQQNAGGVADESTMSNASESYWTLDWTALDPNFGTADDLKELVKKAHGRGIRIVMTAVINNVGPATSEDVAWPSDWIRTAPICDLKSYQGNVSCALAINALDIKTDVESDVALPPHLIAKWKDEGRYESEVKSLDEFFKRTGYPRAPKFYIIKWLTDYVAKYGIDAYRADAANHVEFEIWGQLKSQCNYAFQQWKRNNAKDILNQDEFYLIGDVQNYRIGNGKTFDFGDKQVNYFDNGFNSLMNYDFKEDADKSYELIFNKYATALNNELEYVTVINFQTSHNDNKTLEGINQKSITAANKLMLAPGIAQINYGDEIGSIPTDKSKDQQHSKMNWNDLNSNFDAKNILEHYEKLGQFRKNHPSVGAGIHKQIKQTPYIFSRGYNEAENSDRVIIALNVSKGFKDIPIASIFKTGTKLRDAYSGIVVEVRRDRVQFESDFDTVLLEEL